MATSTPDAHGAPSSVAVRSSRQPGGGDGGVELGRPLGVVELADGVRAQPVDDLGRRVAQRPLLGGEADVHQSSLPGVDERGVHSSRSVRRSTLPDGSRGMASTTTTWRRCL